MVGVPGKSAGCNTCRKRKVKCDFGRPSCRRCIFSDRECEGYARYPVFINRGHEGLMRRGRLEEIRSSVHVPALVSQEARLRMDVPSKLVDESQLISSFWDLYAERACQHGATELAWLHSSVADPSPPVVLKNALLSVACIGLGRIDGEPSLIIKAQQMYGQTLRSMQTALYDHSLMYSDQVLLAARCLVLYETIEATSGDMASWQNHNLGMARIIEGRGAQGHCDVVSRSVLESSRYNLMIVSLMRREASFLGQAQWLTEPWVGTTKSLEQRLYDYGFALAEITQRTEAGSFDAIGSDGAEILSQIVQSYLGLAALNEELLSTRQQHRTTPRPATESPDIESFYSITSAVLAALDLNHSIYASALISNFPESVRTRHHDLIVQISQYTEPSRRFRLAVDLLLHLQSFLKMQHNNVHPIVLYPLNVIRWELRNSPEEKAQVDKLFEVVSVKDGFRLARSVRDVGRSALPRVVAEMDGQDDRRGV